MSAPQHAFFPHALVVGLLAFAGPALAQEQEFTPSDQELNQDLDESLRDEYDTPPPPPPPPPVCDDEDDHDSDRLQLRFGGLAAYAWTSLSRVKLSYREGNSGGGKIDFGRSRGHDRGDNEFEFQNGAGFYRGWIGLGRWVSLQGAWFHGRFQDSNVLGGPNGLPPFTFGRTTFRAGEVAQVKHELRVADYDIVLHPLNLSWIRLDLSVGARYAYWGTSITRRTGPYRKEEKALEGLLPMAGVGLTISPARPLTLFIRGRFGSIELERKGGYQGRGRNRRYVEPKTREHTSAELDGGLTLTIEGIGIILGARIQYLELERTVPERSARFQGYASSLYAGLVFNF
ncbi:MAG: hypothetical protein AB7N76_34220 [Planctomycetota bacterium]